MGHRFSPGPLAVNTCPCHLLAALQAHVCSGPLLLLITVHVPLHAHLPPATSVCLSVICVLCAVAGEEVEFFMALQGFRVDCSGWLDGSSLLLFMDTVVLGCMDSGVPLT